MKKIGIYDSIPRHLHLEPTTDCNARCPQCPRTLLTSPYTNPDLVISEWTPSEIQKVLDDDFFKDLQKILVNGNYGDVVMHSTPREFLEVLFNKNIKVEVRTNGGALPLDFWKWLGTQKNLVVEFGIDGLEDTHHLYRRNTRFDTVIRNAKAFIEAGGSASWAMTVFKHNEHQVEECEKLANELGFDFFKNRPTHRWKSKNLIVVDKNFEQEYLLEPASVIADNYKDRPDDVYLGKEFYQERQQPKDLVEEKIKKDIPIQDNTDVHVECSVQSSPSVYLSGDKKLWPCCWLGLTNGNAINSDMSVINRFYNELGYDKDFNDVTKNSIKKILKSGLFTEIEKSWSSNPFDRCAQMCGKKTGMWTTYHKLIKVSKL